MLQKEQIEQLLNSLSIKQKKIYKKYIQQGYTLQQAKIKYKENTKSSKYYWIAKGYSQQEAIKKVSENNPTHKRYWIAKGYSQQEADKIILSNRKRCILYWLKRYPQEQAIKKYNEYKKTISKSCIQYWLKKGYTQQQGYNKIKQQHQKASARISKIYKKQNSKICKEFWLARGYTYEDAIQKAKQSNKNITKNISKETRVNGIYKYLNNMTPQQKIKYDIKNKKHSQRMKNKNKTHSPIYQQYWIAKGYSEQNAKLQVQNIKYGNRKSTHSSKIQLKCFQQLQKFLNIQFKLQKWISINNSNYCADAKYNNFIFQFNGTNFHLDPRFYNEGNKNPKGVTFQEIRKKDNKKITDYKIKQYNIFIIWEYDYINNKESVFTQIKKEIQNAQKSNTKNLYWDSASIFNKCRRYT